MGREPRKRSAFGSRPALETRTSKRSIGGCRADFRLDLRMSGRAEQRNEVEHDLRETCASSEREGVTLFEREGGEPAPFLNVACACGSAFRLSPRFPAAICLCGRLYHGRPMQAGRVDLDIYPPKKREVPTAVDS